MALPDDLARYLADRLQTENVADLHAALVRVFAWLSFANTGTADQAWTLDLDSLNAAIGNTSGQTAIN